MKRFSMDTMYFGEDEVIALTVGYPNTTLMSLTVPEVGYIMCGLLNVEMLDMLHPERKIIACRHTGISKVDDLLTSKACAVTNEARNQGILPGMTGKEIIEKMLIIKKQRKKK